MDTDNQQAIDALKQIAMAGIEEQRRSRRWGIFFKIVFFLLPVCFLLIMGGMLGSMTQLSNPKLSALAEGKKYAAMVSISGIILEGESASSNNLIKSLQEAFADENAEGVILRCNSPGGSPVQSNHVFMEIMRLREKYPEKPIYAVAEDVCASGGYYIVAAAQDIYADQSSIVGSIGVRMDSFGFVESMKKLGIESRQITAGKNKALLDPFKPQKPEDVAYLEKLLENTHQHFINSVKQGRGDRIDPQKTPELFTGLFWSGDQAKKIGLVDGFGSVRSVARDQLGAETIIDFSYKSDFLDRLSRGLGAAVQVKMLEMQNWVLR
ncbi:MAG: S49 family peptidase [Proteobacteria bacterium]|nr:MAG: S49 family peptidase [Pseudomonadota bacterium]